MNLQSQEPGALLLTIMKMLEGMSPDELHAAVEQHVSDDQERQAFARLSKSAVSYDILLLLSARAICHSAMQSWRRRELASSTYDLPPRVLARRHV